ncbi:MAG: aminotransferase class I/II-fold pyridoxal phosphate-dependent enzyme [Acutalibacteraceae bacterium]
MAIYSEMSREELLNEKQKLEKEYAEFKGRNLKLDMSRGKPGSEQLDLSLDMLTVLNSREQCIVNGTDCRNYGILDGISSMKQIFADLLECGEDDIMVGGNSSLNMMFDAIACMMHAGFEGCEPWEKQGDIKFLCPSPGYDRHFGVTQYFGIKMIPVPMTPTGPDMDIVENLVENDEKVKGIWCVPKYSNPQGITYSDETVTRFAKLKPAAKDFRIMWDNAYCIHDVTDKPEKLLSIVSECKKYGNEDLPLIFASTSKITFPGSGVAAMATSKKNMALFKRRYNFQTIGYDKLNMLRHVLFFKNADGVREHMKKHKAVLAPRFNVVISKLNSQLGGLGVASWLEPNGGYFVSVDVMDGCAKRVVELCREAGVVLTSAGATYPYGEDPHDSNIRIAPSFPPVAELEIAMDLFCLCAKLAATEKLLAQ